MAGFARALRQGDRILVSGTTATHKEKLIGGTDPASQMHFCMDKIEGAIQSLGGRMEDVVRTRIYISDPEIWEPVARAHGQRFHHIQPTNTLVNAGLIGEGYLVEMEAEALVLETPD
jgi:enamine deaminase RidA (YjgF/YER057c/UK114 family)